MTTACFDSSAFVKLLVDEAGSDVAEQLWNQDAVVLASARAVGSGDLVLVCWDRRLAEAAYP